MSEMPDDDAARAVQAFRPNSRPLVLATLANLLLASAFLGVPYLRGRSHAADSLRAFNRFSACLLGGKPRSEPGLLLPAGERTHFAGQVLHADAKWPERCRPALRAVAPPDAVFVWPSVKQAGADVRAIVRLLDRELLQLARNRATGHAARVPTRPLLALAKLQGGLSLLARAVQADAALTSEALSLPARAAVIEPARLPLTAGPSAALTVWAEQDGLQALALDARGVSVLRAVSGQVERARVRRTSLVRAGLRVGEEAALLWAMADDRCAKDEQRCVRRASGFAYLEPSAVELPAPIWLAGHPAARADRSAHVGLAGRIDLLARATSEGALEVRRFATEGRAGKDDESPPLAAAERWPVPATAPPADARLLAGQPAAVVYAMADAAGSMQALLFEYGAGAAADAAQLAIGSAHGAGAWVDACATEQERFIAFGTQTELGLVRLGADRGLAQLLPATPLALGPLVPRDEARRDRVRLLCGSAAPSLIALTEARELFALRCSRDGCARGPLLAREVTGFDAVLSGETLVVAYTRRNEPQIMVTRVDAQGAPLGKPQTPAPCWDPTGGMCGQPTLSLSGSRLLLCARDGSDLLALESNDGGQRWQPLPGLQRSTAISTDPNAPLKQHRLRKGLD